MSARERIKQIIASHIKVWDRSIALYESGQLKMRQGNIDVSKEHFDELKKFRSEQAELLAELDREDASSNPG